MFFFPFCERASFWGPLDLETGHLFPLGSVVENGWSPLPGSLSERRIIVGWVEEGSGEGFLSP